MKKRTVTLFIAMLLVVAIAVGATVAYLTSKPEDVVNTFTVGQVKIKLTETQVDEMGKNPGSRIEGLRDGEEFTNTYKLYPSLEYQKDPMVTVLKDSEACYVRMFVTVKLDSDEAWETLVTNRGALELINCFKDANGEELTKAAIKGDGYWTLGDGKDFVKAVTIDNKAKTIRVEFRHNELIPAATKDTDLDELFTTFTVPKFWDNAEMVALQGMVVTIEAEAIQADGFDDADAAFAGLNAQREAENG